MEHHRTPMTRGLAQADVARNDGLEDIPWKISVNFVADLQGEAGPTIKHCQDNSEHAQPRIQSFSNESDRLHKVRKAFESIELTLQRHEHPISSGEGINGEQTERRWTVDDYVLGAPPLSPKSVTKSVLAALKAHELDLGSDKVDIRGQKAKTYGRGLHSGLSRRLAAEEHVVDGRVAALLLDPETSSSVALWVQVDKESRVPG